jgi:hypothetical protein
VDAVTLALMGVPTGCRSLVLAALVLTAAVALAPDAEANGKKASCRGTKVAVKAGTRTTCVPFAKVFPQPKEIDTRLAFIQQVVKFDPASAANGKKRKRVRKLQGSFRAAARRAQTKLLKVAPKALAFIDSHGGAASSSIFPAGPAFASSGCHPGPAGPTGGFEGASIGLLGDNGGYMDVPIGGGLHAKITFVSCGGVTALNIPPCPTANGIVDGKGRGEFSVTFEIRSSSRVLSRNTTNFEQKAKIHGEVGPDAKLKSIDVEHTEELFIVATTEGYPIVIRGGVTRKVHIPMPSGQYDPASATARFFGDPLKPDTGAEAFANTAKAAITSYRSAEGNWSSFDHQPFCAEPVFDPASNAIKLKKGDQKQVSIYAKARADGGRATEARWSLLAPLNADFSPTSSQDASPTIQYTVSKTPVGDQVKVTVRVTSTAGVGQKTWTEPIEASGIEIEGSFGGELSAETPLEVPSVQKWTGVVSLHLLVPGEGGGRNGTYAVTSGNVSGDLSGIESSGITGCHQSGSAQGPIPGGTMTVTGTGPENGPPYEYEIDLSMPFVPVHALRVAPCPKAAQEEGYEGTEFETGINWELHVSGQMSGDGVTFTGTKDESFGSVSIDQHWNLHPTE